MNGWFEKNLDILSKKHPGAESFLRREQTGGKVSIDRTRSRNDHPTARVNGRFLHSKLDPVREAERIAAHSVDSSAGVCVFLGFGYGYHIERFLEREAEKIAVAVEREPGILRSAMEERDLRALFAHPRAVILLDPAPEEIRSALSVW